MANKRKKAKKQRIKGPKRGRPSKTKVLIPATIFSEKLSSLEAISKYMKENLDLGCNEIAALTNRNNKTIWQAYYSSRKKFPARFRPAKTRYLIPVSILKTRYYSILESIAVFLKEDFGLSYHDISVMLARDDRTIWTVCQRAGKKKGNEKDMIRESRKRVKELTKRMAMCREYKKKIAKFASDLKEKYDLGELGYSEYQAKLRKHLEGKPVEEWVRYYDGLVEEYKAKLSEENSYIEALLRKKNQ